MMTDVMTKSHQLIASDRVEGTAVRRPNGDKIGHIERLMIDKISGKVSYAILSFGGFLGMGTKLLPLPWARLTYNPRFEAYQLDIDDEELQARAVIPRRQGFRLGRSFAGSRVASLLRNSALLGRLLDRASYADPCSAEPMKIFVNAIVARAATKCACVELERPMCWRVFS